MSMVTVDIPEHLYSVAGELAQASGVTIHQLVASALAEKVSALAGSEWFSQRSARGDRAKFEAALREVADVEPEEKDQL